jgi:hypothetical protein
MKNRNYVRQCFMPFRGAGRDVAAYGAWGIPAARAPVEHRAPVFLYVAG